MRDLLNECVEFYSMLEYFTTKNDDDITNRMPSIPLKPFIEGEAVNEKVKSVINDKYFADVKVKCVFLTKNK